VTPHSTASADRPRYGLVVRRTPFPDENELGFVPFDRVGGELLFNLLTERYERRSVVRV
jgi:hypothetical protein